MRINWTAPRDPAHLAYYGLDELFPTAPALSARFNSDAGFRQRLRAAMRGDLFRPVPKLSEQENAELRELFVDLAKPHVKAPLWEANEKGHFRLRPLPNLTEVLLAHGIDLTGEAFVERLLWLGALAESSRFSDLVGKPHEGHRWHQDHGEDRYTVMLGFPPKNHFEGAGVFSHVLRVSHALQVPRVDDGWASGTPIVVRLQPPEEAVLRPVYRPGQEVLVWRDSACLHSTPDVVNREALWRFM